MKKIVSLLLVAALMLAISAPAYADASGKLKAGVKQIFTCPKTFYETVVEEKNASEFKPFGIVGGIFKGSFYAIKDIGLGLLNTVTFFVDNKDF